MLLVKCKVALGSPHHRAPNCCTIPSLLHHAVEPTLNNPLAPNRGDGSGFTSRRDAGKLAGLDAADGKAGHGFTFSSYLRYLQS